jgi:electron transport complex protein RnfE
MIKTLKNGLFTENPTFVQLLGMCPTLAVTTTVFNGFGMGIAATVVLIGSNVVVSLLRKCIPEKVRIAAYVVIIAGFVSLIQMLLEAFVPALSNSLGIFLPLIVVNCIILARAEAFASKNGVLKSAVDGLGMGLGFTGALVIVSAVREIVGLGTLFAGLPFEIAIPVYSEMPATVFALPAGGFLTLGLILGVINAIRLRKEESK